MQIPRIVASFGRLARAAFPLSPRGLVFLLIASALLAAGLARADLAALFWGSSFLLFTAYSLAAGHLLRLALRRRSAAGSDFLSIRLPSSGLSPGEQAEAQVTALLPRAFPPGFSVRLLYPLSWHEQGILPISARLAPGRNQASVTFRAGRRGAYAGSAAMLELRDVLSFTAHRVRVPLVESLVVFPALHLVEELARFMEQAEESAAHAPRRRRSEDLLEARKYYPGDDVRRLNWKVFAHLNELFLRVGEEVPPPDSRILFALDTSANPLVPRHAAAHFLDGLVEACASVMVALIERRIEVLLSLPGARACIAYAQESRQALLAALAGAWWTEAAWAPELPATAHLHVAVFSTPGSPGLERIMAAVNGRGWSASLFLKGLDREPPRRARRFSELLFLPETGSPGRVPGLGGPARAGLEDALARDLARFRAPAGKVRHAAEL